MRRADAPGGRPGGDLGRQAGRLVGAAWLKEA
jgi:hypothetical protein